MVKLFGRVTALVLAVLICNTAAGQIKREAVAGLYSARFEHTKVTIGDKNRPGQFNAHTEFEIWGGEDSLTLEIKDAKGSESFAGEKIALTAAGLEMEWRLADPCEVKWIFTFGSKPATNTYSLEVGGNRQDFDFFYQSPFESPESFVRNGEQWLRQHTRLGRAGTDYERPRKVDGSYAVYHKTKRHGQYKTGKAFHIYVPKATDADGKTAWCTLHIEDGQYTVIIPQDYLDKAVYPVVINDTFGIVAEGGSGASQSAGRVFGADATPASSGSATTIHFLTDDGDNMTGGLYDSSDNLLRDTAEITSDQGSKAWNTLTLDSPLAVVGSTTYQICMHWETTTRIYHDDQAGEGRYSWAHGYTGGTMPDPVSWSVDPSDERYSLYATYTPSGGSDGQVVIFRTK